MFSFFPIFKAVTEFEMQLIGKDTVLKDWHINW